MSEIDILVSEVGPRDGLQSIETIMPTEAKKAWIAAEAEAGVREIEVGSFVPAKLLPQMADTAEIVAYARTLPGLAVIALVPNFKGAENAVKAGVHKIGLPLSCSETHSKANLRKTHDEVIEEARNYSTRCPLINVRDLKAAFPRHSVVRSKAEYRNLKSSNWPDD